MRNTSEQFEARVCMVEIPGSASVMLGPMKGTRVPIAVAHGEGKAEFTDSNISSAAGVWRLMGGGCTLTEVGKSPF